MTWRTRVELAQIQFHAALETLHAIQENMAENPESETDYAEALYGVLLLLQMVEKDIQEAVA